MNFHEHLKIHGFSKTQEEVHKTYKMYHHLDKESSEIIKQFHKDWKDYLETNSIPDPYKTMNKIYKGTSDAMGEYTMQNMYDFKVECTSGSTGSLGIK